MWSSGGFSHILMFPSSSKGFDTGEILISDKVGWQVQECSFYYFYMLRLFGSKMVKASLFFFLRVIGKDKMPDLLPLPLLYLPRPLTHTGVTVSAQSGVRRRRGALQQWKIPSGLWVLIYSCVWAQSI